MLLKIECVIQLLLIEQNKWGGRGKVQLEIQITFPLFLPHIGAAQLNLRWSELGRVVHSYYFHGKEDWVCYENKSLI